DCVVSSIDLRKRIASARQRTLLNLKLSLLTVEVASILIVIFHLSRFICRLPFLLDAFNQISLAVSLPCGMVDDLRRRAGGAADSLDVLRRIICTLVYVGLDREGG